MRYFYFDIRDDRGLSVDHEGIECPDLDVAQEEAARSLIDMARDAVHSAKLNLRHQMSIEVRDDNGAALTLKFSFLKCLNAIEARRVDAC